MVVVSPKWIDHLQSRSAYSHLFPNRQLNVGTKKHKTPLPARKRM